MALKEIFKDENDINEKSVVGFAAFTIMTLFALGNLTDCSIATVDIMADPKLPTEYKIVVVPTILILEDGEEVARFQANIMMTMEATRKEVQGSIDEIIMSKF